MKVLQQGPLAAFLNRFIDLILLNVLWLLCSLPLFTLGASTCAVYDVTVRFAFHEDVSIVRTFFHSFRKNFWKATALFLIFLGVGLFLAIDLWCAVKWDTKIQFLFIVVILAVAYFYLAVLSHLFPVLAYFQTGVKESVKRAFLLSMKNGVFTVFIMVMDLLPVFAVLVFPNYFGQIIFLYVVVGFCAIAMLNSLHLARLFDPERAKAADEEADKEAGAC